MISPAVASLADAALLLPASVLLALYLAVLRRWRLLAAWVVALALAGGVTVVAKLVFHACGRAITDADVVSPSGHASFAVIFYGALALMLGTGRTRRVQVALGAGVALFVVAVGISRVRTEAHTPQEVVIGVAIGLLALLTFWQLYRRSGRPVVPVAPVMAGFGLALLVLGGAHFSLEHSIGRAARRLSDSLDVCAAPERIARSRFHAMR